jgi:hypothetical protein
VLTVTAVCDQYAWLYTDLPVPDGTWDHVIPVDGSYCALKKIEGIWYVMWRGSTTFLDWIQDFDDCAIPYQDQILGDVHPGARDGVLAVKAQIDVIVGDEPVASIGHSLGAMHAVIYAGYRVVEGKPVNWLLTFGEPRSGGPKLSAILALTKIDGFRNADQNGHDLVTDVARSLPPLLPYQHARDPLTDCHRSPNPLDLWMAFRYHHFRLYCASMGSAGPAVLSLPDPGLGP